MKPLKIIQRLHCSSMYQIENRSGKRDSNSRPQPWQGCALPTELFPQLKVKRRRLELPRLAALPPQSSASTNSATSPNEYKYKWCPRQESNLHAFRHTHLKRARLPIPPLGQSMERKTRLELATPTLARLCSTN